MFLDESAFDMDDNNKGFRRTSTADDASRFNNLGEMRDFAQRAPIEYTQHLQDDSVHAAYTQ